MRHIYSLQRVCRVLPRSKGAAAAALAPAALALAPAADAATALAAAAHAAAALSTGANRAAHLEPTRRLHYTGVDVFDV